MTTVDSVVILPRLHLVTNVLTIGRIATFTIWTLCYVGLALYIVNIETFASLIYNHFLNLNDI